MSSEVSISLVLLQAKQMLRQSLIKDVQQCYAVDAEIILCFVLQIEDRKFLIINSDQILNKTIINLYFDLIKERILGKPVAYIVGYKYFFGYKFFVDQSTLIPRDDSEILIEESLKILNQDFVCFSEKINLLDLGAGSGCLGLSIAKEFKNLAKLYLVEKNFDACMKIKQNISALSLEEKTVLINDCWLNILNDVEEIDFIISNPPYISLDEKNNLMHPVVGFEPHYALFDQNINIDFNLSVNKNLPTNQLSTYQQIIQIANKILKKNGYLVFEIDGTWPNIWWPENVFVKIGLFNDLRNLPRCLVLKKII